MSGSAAADMFARTRPQGYSAISEVATRRHNVISVVGVVTDLLEPRATRGTDWQMTFDLIDIDEKKVRVKFFKPKEDLPRVEQNGDVVFLRDIRINTYGGQKGLLSDTKTGFIVFPKDTIPKPANRHAFMDATTTFEHFASKQERVNAHMQQWAISLRDQFRRDFPHGQVTPRQAVVKQAFAPGGLTSPNTALFAPRDRFSWLRGIKIEGAGSFYDLVGEVVKIFYDRGHLDVTEIYITDYTENKILRDHDPNDSYGYGQDKWQGPQGRRTLRIDLMAPHSHWAREHVHEGDFVLLKNVRVKWNRNGGMEAEGCVFYDSKYPTKVGIVHLDPEDKRYVPLLAQKDQYQRETGRSSFVPHSEVVERQGESKQQRKKRKKREKRAEELAALEAAAADNHDDDYHSDSEEEERFPKRRRVETSKDATKSKYNPNVICELDNDNPSTLKVIINNLHRQNTTPAGSTYEMPFVNVMHLARIKIVDFFPHRLDDFVKEVKVKGRSTLIWSFWLAVQDAASTKATLAEGEEPPTLNVHVAGAAAEKLLGLMPAKLRGKGEEKNLNSLREKLFLLWGDLAEKKDIFLRSHPHIKPDGDFSALKYNIVADNLPFEAGIAECGVEVKTGDGGKAWVMVHKLLRTRIV